MRNGQRMSDVVRLVCVHCMRSIFEEGDGFLHWDPKQDLPPWQHEATPWQHERTEAELQKMLVKELDKASAEE